MKIEKAIVEEAAAREISGTSNKTGKPFKFFTQELLIWGAGEKHPHRAEVILPDNRNGMPYEPGDYDIEPDFWINGRGNLQVSALVKPKMSAAKTGTNG